MHTYVHCMESKDPNIHVLNGWMPSKKPHKHTQYVPSTKMECDYL